MPDFLGSLVSYGANRIAQERSFEQQKELQGDAQSYNTLMWNKANEYNSPYQQMLRFKSAGLNPNLIYGQMNNGLAAPTVSAGSAPSPAQMQSPSMMETAQLGLLEAQKRNIDADTQDKLAGAGEKGANTQLITTQEMINKADLDIRKKLADSQISVNDETLNQIKANIAQIAQTTENLKVENAIASLQLQWDRASFDDRVKLVQAQWKAANAQANLSNVQAHRITTLLNQELSNLQAEFSNIVANTNLTEQQKSNMAQQKIIDAADNFYLKVATDAHNSGNEFKAFGAELVHMFTHLFKFGKNF